MSISRTSQLLLFLLFVLVKTNYRSFSQTTSYPIDEWVKKLGAKKAQVFSGVYEILSVLKGKDSAECAALFDELEKQGSSANNYFVARYNLTRAVWLHEYPGAKSLNELRRKALTG